MWAKVPMLPAIPLQEATHVSKMDCETSPFLSQTSSEPKHEERGYAVDDCPLDGSVGLARSRWRTITDNIYKDVRDSSALGVLASGARYVLIAYVLASLAWFAKGTIPPRLSSCGETVEEASRRGCVFDPLTVTWLPSSCYRGSTQEFLDAGPHNGSWGYWRDQDGKVPVSDLGARIGEKVYWTTEGEHLTHCAYLIIRNAAAQEMGMRLDRTSGSMHHTRHCAMFLLEAAKHKPTFNSIITAGNVALGAC